MTTFSFSVQIAGIDTTTDDFEDKFYGNRCDDALISVVDGRLQLDFDREASSFGAAVGSAVDDIERAGGRVVKIDPLPPAGEDSHRMRG